MCSFSFWTCLTLILHFYIWSHLLTCFVIVENNDNLKLNVFLFILDLVLFLLIRYDLVVARSLSQNHNVRISCHQNSSFSSWSCLVLAYKTAVLLFGLELWILLRNLIFRNLNIILFLQLNGLDVFKLFFFLNLSYLQIFFLYLVLSLLMRQLCYYLVCSPESYYEISSYKTSMSFFFFLNLSYLQSSSFLLGLVLSLLISQLCYYSVYSPESYYKISSYKTSMSFFFFLNLFYLQSSSFLLGLVLSLVISQLCYYSVYSPESYYKISSFKTSMLFFSS